MLTSDLSYQVESALDRFAWEEWAQMGVFATAGPPRRWAQDPEALLLLTFEVARGDPRLFDEVLDWLITNEQLVSLRRLRSLAVDPEDRALSEAVIAWLGRQRPKARFASSPPPQPPAEPRVLFLQEGFPVPRPDPAFAQHGWLRPAFAGTGKSMSPSIDTPINLSFRFRLLFGLTARAELARLLFTMDAAAVTSATLARAAGFTKRNVDEALASFVRAGVVSTRGTGYALRYRADHARWGAFLEMPDSVEHVDWIPISVSLRRILRWTREASGSERSEYLISSSARDLLERIRPDLEEADIELPAGHSAASALSDLSTAVRQVLERLDTA